LLLLCVLAVLLVEQLLVEGQALVMKGVAHLVALGVQVGLVGIAPTGSAPVRDREAVALQPEDLRIVVRMRMLDRPRSTRICAPMP
jgi:hypothetical protein